MPYLEDLFSLRDRVALVSGASRGIGLAIAAGLAQAGAAVVGFGTSVAPQAGLGDVTYQRCDVTDAGAFAGLCDGVVSDHGRLDVYVHAAGISLQSDPSRDRADTFARTVEVNLTAAYRCCLAVSERMAPDRGGSIIAITSIGALLGFPQNPGYASSKGGLRMLTKALALDFAERRIRVNAIAPGYVRTAMTEASYQDPRRFEERLQRTILKRWGTPQDLVGAAIFLASDASSYVTGQEIVVDGGWTAKGL
ncbi:MAG: SDR family oxidoreductase [bacterium]